MSTTLPAPLCTPPPPLPPILCPSPSPGRKPDHARTANGGSAFQAIGDSRSTTAAAAATSTAVSTTKHSIVVEAPRTINAASVSDSNANSNANPNAAPEPEPAPEPLSETLRKLELASAKMHNFRLAARNARNARGRLELLEKTIPGAGVGLADALALAPTKTNGNASGPAPDPPKIRDRPKGFAHLTHIGDFTAQDILDLVVFYNDDFGIVLADDEAARRGKLLGFLTGGAGSGDRVRVE